MKSYQCYKCQKEINSGKFYGFYTGKRGGKRMAEYRFGNKRERDFFCPSCFKKEKKEPTAIIDPENLLEVEWEVGNQDDEEILELEKKWENFYFENEFTKYDKATDDKKILAWCQEAKKELEPFLQKPKIVEKSFGGKIEGCGKKTVNFYYLFAKSAQEENYRKETVEPTIAEIFGINKLEQEINTTIANSGPGVAGRASGTFEIENKKINYSWIDGPQGEHFRRICFEVFDQKLALEAFCRGVEVKIKELGGDNSPEPNPKKTCAECGKDISRQEFTYSSESSSEKKKTFCSQECLEKAKNKDNKPPKNNPSNSQNENSSEKKGMSTGLKVFLGISAAVLVLIVIILVIIWLRSKETSQERERERERQKV